MGRLWEIISDLVQESPMAVLAVLVVGLVILIVCSLIWSALQRI